jgi:hypothetical protein
MEKVEKYLDGCFFETLLSLLARPMRGVRSVSKYLSGLGDGFSNAGGYDGSCFYELPQKMKPVAMRVITRRCVQKLDDDFWRKFILRWQIGHTRRQ